MATGATYAQSQLGSNPFSRFGIGDLIPQQNVRNIGMGMTGLANPDPDFVNFQNPALLTFNKLTNLDLGFSYKASNQGDVSGEYNARGGGVSFLSFAFPLTNKLTIAANLAPITSVDYAVRFNSKFADGKQFNTLLYGTGGLNKLNLAAGFNLTKRLTAGVNPSLIFGTINNQTGYSISDPGTATSPSVNTVINTTVFDATIKGGLNYRLPLDTLDKYFLSFGLVAELGRGLNASRIARVDYVPDRSSSYFRPSDTLSTNSAKVSYPGMVGTGISFSKLLGYSLSADIQYHLFEGNTFSGEQAPYKNAFMIGLGGEWTPNAYSKSYLGICTYRLGLNWNQNPLVINGNQVDDRSITFGLTAPITRKEAKFTRPYISAALQIGQRGTISQHNLRENYFRLSFSFTLNDATWFKRYKHD